MVCIRYFMYFCFRKQKKNSFNFFFGFYSFSNWFELSNPRIIHMSVLVDSDAFRKKYTHFSICSAEVTLSKRPIAKGGSAVKNTLYKPIVHRSNKIWPDLFRIKMSMSRSKTRFLIQLTIQSKWRTTALSRTGRCFCRSCTGSVCTSGCSSTRRAPATTFADS